MPEKHIVIVGAGFAGLLTARKLVKRVPAGTLVTLIDRNDRFLFAPRLIDALAESSRPPSSYSAPLGALCQRDGIRFIQGTVIAVDRRTRSIKLESGTPEPFDILVLCQGAKINHYGIPGAQEHTCALKTTDDIACIVGEIEALLKKATQAPTDAMQRALLSFVIIGGGASGIESAFALKERFTELATKLAPTLSKFASFTVIQAAPQILPGFPLRTVEGARRELRANGFTLIEGLPVTQIDEDSVTTADGSKRMSGFVLWAAGVQPNGIAIEPEAFTDTNGGILTDRFLQVEPHVFAAGDVISYQEKNVVIPKNAQTAMLMAERLAENITRSLQGLPPKAFHYTNKGNLLTLGATGYIDIKGFAFKSRLTPLFRDLFYRYRQWQMIG